MNLTEGQQAAIDLAFEEWGAWDVPPCDFPEYAFLAGLRMGRAEGREQAAKACETRCGGCVDAIRALPEEPT